MGQAFSTAQGWAFRSTPQNSSKVVKFFPNLKANLTHSPSDLVIGIEVGREGWGRGCPYCILTKIWYTSFWSWSHIVAFIKNCFKYTLWRKTAHRMDNTVFLPLSQGIRGCFVLKTASYSSWTRTAHSTDNIVLWPLSQGICGCFVLKTALYTSRRKTAHRTDNIVFWPLSQGIHGCFVHVLQGEKQLTERTTLCSAPLSRGIHGCFVHILQGEKQLTERTTLCFDLFLGVFNQLQQRATANAHPWPRECCARTYQGGVQLRLHQVHEEVPPDLQKLLAVPRLGHCGHCLRGRVERMVPGLDRANKMNYLDFLTKPAQRTFNKHLSSLKVFKTYRLHFHLRCWLALAVEWAPNTCAPRLVHISSMPASASFFTGMANIVLLWMTTAKIKKHSAGK